MPVVLTGNEVIDVGGADNTGRASPIRQIANTAAIAALNLTGAVAVTLPGAGNITLTAAQLGGASDVAIILSGALSAGANLQLPTVAQMVGLLPVQAAGGQGWNIKVVNASSGAFAWTVTAPAGWTLVGTMTVAQNTTRSFVAQFNGGGAMTLTSTGTGTYS